MDDKLYNRTIEFLSEQFKNDSSGHDLDHTLRVSRMAVTIAENEHADASLCELAALMHDVDDYKLSPDTEAEHRNARSFMNRENIPDEEIEAVIHIIEQVSFSGTDTQVPDTLEGKIVQDADRLDAIGAIGIARAFAYGGAHGRKLYDPKEIPENHLSKAEYRNHVSTTVNHFHEKLFLLKNMMNTETAKQIAIHRDEFMHAWLDEFLLEWDGRNQFR